MQEMARVHQPREQVGIRKCSISESSMGMGEQTAAPFSERVCTNISRTPR